jgi:hypothetical protein
MRWREVVQGEEEKEEEGFNTRKKRLGEERKTY